MAGRLYFFLETCLLDNERSIFIGPPYHRDLLYANKIFASKYSQFYPQPEHESGIRKWWILIKNDAIFLSERFAYKFTLEITQARLKIAERVKEQLDTRGDVSLIYTSDKLLNLKPYGIEISTPINSLFKTLICDTLPEELDEGVSRKMFYPIIPMLRYIFTSSLKRVLIWNELTHRLYMCKLIDVSPFILFGEDYRTEDTVNFVFDIVDYDSNHYGIAKLKSLANLNNASWFGKDDMIY